MTERVARARILPRKRKLQSAKASSSRKVRRNGSTQRPEARPSDPSNIAENFGAVSIPHCRCDRLHKICFVLKVFLEMIINHSAVDVMARLGDHLSQGRLRGLRRQIIPTAVKAIKPRLGQSRLYPWIFPDGKVNSPKIYTPSMVHEVVWFFTPAIA